ncbi:alpha/beta hydrolase [Butyrivibrio proteoclasticus]|uniref:alpha/beta hydrolase n=1 Tax=Butyrivibrio proteoclasticus TaxID=43305 RepID=UPI00047D82B6|nr:alpha/beta hydrolase [Butyrivibrio proteoclasticus]
MKKLMKILIIILCILLVICIYIAFWLPKFIMTGNRQTLEEAYNWQMEHYDASYYNELDKTDYIVKGFEDYELHVQFLKNPNPTTKYMILTHGYTDNHIGTLKYVKMYLDLGFNCVIYDLRGHGENEPTFTTYGIREAKDLICVIDDTRERYSDITVLGLHGESLGSATTITSLKYKPQVDFAVCDCGFSDIENVLRNGYKNLHLPTWLYDVANFTGKIRYHYVLGEMRPIDSLDDNEVPILFIHGAEDTLIVPKNSEDMAQRTKGYSEVHIIPGAEHAMSMLTAPEDYVEYVTGFLKKISIIE